jgi:Ras GTPase-activating-like protein IQGAP2/3
MARNERPPNTIPVPPKSPTAAFAYQTRLLEGSSTLSRTSSLSRAPSLTKGLLSPGGARRWTPSHRTALSTDSTRPERPRIETGYSDDVESRSRGAPDASRVASQVDQWGESHDSASRSSARPFPVIGTPQISDSRATALPTLPRRNTYSSPRKLPDGLESDRTPTKRSTTPWDLPEHTRPTESYRPPLPPEYQRFDAPPIPTPVIPRHRSSPSVDSVRGRWEERVKEAEAAEITPQSTGSSQKRWTANSGSGSLSRPLPLPSPERSTPHRVPQTSSQPKESALPIPPYIKQQTPLNSGFPSTVREQWKERTRTNDASGPDELGRVSVSLERNASPELRSRTRTTSAGSSSERFSSIPKQQIPAPSVTPSYSAKTPDSQFSPFSSTSTVSRYPPLKKRENYGALGSRRLGQHLPRIASGDGNEDWEEPEPQSSPNGQSTGHRYAPAPVASELDEPRYWDHPSPLHTPQQSPTRTELLMSPVNGASVVAGKPDRIRLSRQDMPPPTPSPLPSVRLTRGLWADVQRHFLIAYEYLCHIGEAQQWIEGCLNEELGFGVVEMEEGLRNGVVLARLARIWEGDAVVRRIFEVGDKTVS